MNNRQIRSNGDNPASNGQHSQPGSQGRMPPATLGADGRPVRQLNIPPAQVAQLVQALKSEMALARASEDDKVKQQQHFSKAESIRNILVNYQAQQKARMLQQQQQQQQQPPQQQQQQQQQPPQQQQQHQQQHSQSSQQPVNSYPPTSQQALNSQLHNQNLSPMIQSTQASNISPMPQHQSLHQSPMPQHQSLHQSPMSNAPRGNTPNLNSAQMHMHAPNMQSPAIQSPQLSQGINLSRIGTPNSTGVGRPPPAPAHSQNAPSITTTPERFNQLKQLLVEIQRKIQILEQRKTTSTLAEATAAIDKEIMDWKLKFSQFQRVGLIMRSELIEQAKLSQANNSLQPPRQFKPSSPFMPTQPSQNQSENRAAPQQQLQQQQLLQQQPQQQQMQSGHQVQREIPMQSQQHMPQSSLQPQPVPSQQQSFIPQHTQGPTNNQFPGAQRRAGPAAVAGASSASGTMNTAASTSVPQFTARPSPLGPRSAPDSNGPRPDSGPSNRSQEPPPLNLQGITKPSVLPMPIASTISVKPPVAVTFDANVDGRPSITGGSLLSLGGWINAPAITKMPVFGLAESAGSMSADVRAAAATSGSHIFGKRKLAELVSSLGADEGDGKTGIDGNVEDLLLDLLDEFLQSVTGFACRLAKHRKVNTIEARDVQLHLEKNWNIRIPGYAMDEIRLTRKINPTNSYAQKKAGLEIAKSVNEHP